MICARAGRARPVDRGVVVRRGRSPRVAPAVPNRDDSLRIVLLTSDYEKLTIVYIGVTMLIREGTQNPGDGKEMEMAAVIAPPDQLQTLFEQAVREGVQLWQRPDGTVYARPARQTVSAPRAVPRPDRL